MRNITVHFNSTLPHFTQLLSGLEYLKDNNLIDLKYRLSLFEYPPYIFKVELDNKLLFFDLADSTDIHLPTYELADFYIKRMLLKSDMKDRKKLYPYGLNYQVYYRNQFLKGLFLKDKQLLEYSLRFSRTASSLLKMKNSISTSELDEMCSSPASGRQILFRGRLWNPADTGIVWKKKERQKMNRLRVDLNLLLRPKFGDSFTGGIEADEFSKDECPEVLLPQQEYHKKNYLKLLRTSSIGVASQGLEGSIGFKFSEYLAHGLAVVTTPIEDFQLLGPLQKNVNYLDFTDTRECLNNIEILYTNDRRRKEMQQANWNYYNNWLHPGVKLQKIFEMIETQ